MDELSGVQSDTGAELIRESCEAGRLWVRAWLHWYLSSSYLLPSLASGMWLLFSRLEANGDGKGRTALDPMVLVVQNLAALVALLEMGQILGVRAQHT